MADFRDGYGQEDLVDMDSLDDDNFDANDDIMGDIEGIENTMDPNYSGGEGENYDNVNQVQGGVGSQLGAFYEKEFIAGLTAIGSGTSQSFKALGQLPLGGLGGLWTGWLFYGIIFVVVGFIGSIIARRTLGIDSGLRNIMNGVFYSGLFTVPTGIIAGIIITVKLMHGDKALFSDEALVPTEADTSIDEEDGYDGEIEDMGAGEEMEEDEETDNPYDIYDEGLESGLDEGGEVPDDSPVEQVNNVSVVTINRTLDNLSELSALGSQGAELMYKIACDILPGATPSFSKIEDIEADSPIWNTIKAKLLTALNLCSGVDIDDIPTNIVSIKKSRISFCITATRFAKVKSDAQLRSLADELSSLFNQDKGISEGVVISDESTTVCRVTTKGQNYVITVINPKRPLITLGDVLRTDSCKKFMLDKKNALPICLGLDDLGQMVFWDAKGDTASMLCGQSRSGKSWFTAYYFLNMMIIKQPTESQYILVDPKNTGLFNALAKMPHCMGLHTPAEGDSNVPQDMVNLLKEIVQKEGERRKTLLREAGAENYWDYIKANGSTSLPLLTLVIDEFTSLSKALKEDPDCEKEFMNLLTALVVKMPAYGLRLLIIPHRVVGTVKPETRDLMKFKATFRSSEELSTGNLGIPKLGFALPSPGDMAWIREGSDTPLSTHTLGVAPDDNAMKDCILLIAKAYYKLGVEIPDMSYMRTSYTRNDTEIIGSLRQIGK